MKINHLLLSLASISLAVISTQAASVENKTECILLPVYNVEVPRHTAAEREINRSLAELRAAARTPLEIKTEIPLVNNNRSSGRDEVKPAPRLVVARE